MSLEQHISEALAVPVATLTDSVTLSDIPTWDSLAHMMLIVRLEETYQIQFEGDEIADLRSVGDIRSILRARGAPV